MYDTPFEKQRLISKFDSYRKKNLTFVKYEFFNIYKYYFYIKKKRQIEIYLSQFNEVKN